MSAFGAKIPWPAGDPAGGGGPTLGEGAALGRLGAGGLGLGAHGRARAGAHGRARTGGRAGACGRARGRACRRAGAFRRAGAGGRACARGLARADRRGCRRARRRRCCRARGRSGIGPSRQAVAWASPRCAACRQLPAMPIQFRRLRSRGPAAMEGVAPCLDSRQRLAQRRGQCDDTRHCHGSGQQGGQSRACPGPASAACPAAAAGLLGGGKDRWQPGHERVQARRAAVAQAAIIAASSTGRGRGNERRIRSRPPSAG